MTSATLPVQTLAASADAPARTADQGTLAGLFTDFHLFSISLSDVLGALGLLVLCLLAIKVLLRIVGRSLDKLHVDHSLRAFVLEHVQQELGERASVDLGVPLGSLLGGPFLNGRGPDLPVRVTFSGIVTAEFESSFTAAGYNQTRHTVSLRVTADAYTYLLGAESQLQAETVIPVSETILVGEVPYVVGDVPVS